MFENYKNNSVFVTNLLKYKVSTSLNVDFMLALAMRLTLYKIYKVVMANKSANNTKYD